MNGDRLIRVATAAVVTAVAGFAAVVSYSHVFDLGRVHGQSGTAARMLPLSVDGLILAASLVLLHEARNDRRPPALARLALWLGVGATIAANALYGLAWGTLGVLLSAWPGAAFVIAVEMLMGLIKRARAATGSPPARPAVAADAQSAAKAAYTASVAGGNPLSGRQLETRFGLSRAAATRVRQSVAAEANGHGGQPGQLTTIAAADRGQRADSPMAPAPGRANPPPSRENT